MVVVVVVVRAGGGGGGGGRRRCGARVGLNTNSEHPNHLCLSRPDRLAGRLRLADQAPPVHVSLHVGLSTFKWPEFIIQNAAWIPGSHR